MIKTSIIGIGNAGRTYADIILSGKCPELELSSVVVNSPRSREFAENNYKGVKVFDTAKEMIDDGTQAVIISVPHYYHTSYAIECFRHGINVLLEKPAGVYTKEVRKMNREAQKSGVVFGMMFNKRSDPVYIKTRELVQSGKFGSIRRVNWISTNWLRTQEYYNSGKWRATWAGEGGGVLLNQSHHDLDLWQWICGMPDSINARIKCGHWHNTEVEDDVSIYAEYPNGATGVFVSSTGDAPGTNRLEITMDKGRIVTEDGKITVTELDISASHFISDSKEAFGMPDFKRYDIEVTPEKEQHKVIMNSFASAVLHKTPLIAEGVDGINALELTNAAYLSSWLKKEISLPLDDELYYNELTKHKKA